MKKKMDWKILIITLSIPVTIVAGAYVYAAARDGYGHWSRNQPSCSQQICLPR